MASPSELDPSLAGAGATLVGRSCVVALSGGPDSAGLAWLAKRFARTARAIHVDHGQKHSPMLAAAAEKVASEVGIEFSKVAVEVPANGSFEAQARQARYGALYEALEPGEVLLTGHTAHDNAETFLLNVIRGAGMTGLGGIPIERGVVMRPLLEVSRQIVGDLVRSQKLSAVSDPTNEDVSRSRNRIRHEVLPVLGDPLVIARAARLVSADTEVLEDLAGSVPIRVRPDQVSIPAAALVTLPRPIANRVIRRGLRLVNPPYAGSSRMIEAVWLLLSGDSGRTELGEGVSVYRSEGSVVLQRDVPNVPDPVVLAAPQSVFGEWILSVAELDGPPPALPIGPGYAAFSDPPELVVRSASPGDRVPLRNGGHKELADVFAEAGIARERRRSWPIVASDNLVWWVPAVRQGWLGWGDGRSDRYLVANILLEGQ